MYSSSSYNNDVPSVNYAPLAAVMGTQQQDASEESCAESHDNEPLILGSPTGNYCMDCCHCNHKNNTILLITLCSLNLLF